MKKQSLEKLQKVEGSLSDTIFIRDLTYTSKSGKEYLIFKDYDPKNL